MIYCLSFLYESTIFSIVLIVCHINVVAQKCVVIDFFIKHKKKSASDIHGFRISNYIGFKA